MPETKEVILPSRIESVEEAALKASEYTKQWGFDADFISAVDMAVRESVANAIKHGNKLDETKKVEVTFVLAGDRVEISVRDFGAGFAPEQIPDPTNPANLLKACGRGIFFMCTFMDEVEWFNHPGGGMVVRMVKKAMGNK